MAALSAWICLEAQNAKMPANQVQAKAEGASTLDPQLKAVINQLKSMGGKPIDTLSAPEARQQPSPTDAVKVLLKKQGKSTAPEPGGERSEPNHP